VFGRCSDSDGPTFRVGRPIRHRSASQEREEDVVAELERWGREVDLCGIDEPEALLQAALLLPRSVTATSTAFETLATR
jgi:hypothetical protein